MTLWLSHTHWHSHPPISLSLHHHIDHDQAHQQLDIQDTESIVTPEIKTTVSPVTLNIDTAGVLAHMHHKVCTWSSLTLLLLTPLTSLSHLPPSHQSPQQHTHNNDNKWWVPLSFPYTNLTPPTTLFHISCTHTQQYRQQNKDDTAARPCMHAHPAPMHVQPPHMSSSQHKHHQQHQWRQRWHDTHGQCHGKDVWQCQCDSHCQCQGEDNDNDNNDCSPPLWPHHHHDPTATPTKTTTTGPHNSDNDNDNGDMATPQRQRQWSDACGHCHGATMMTTTATWPHHSDNDDDENDNGHMATVQRWRQHQCDTCGQCHSTTTTTTWPWCNNEDDVDMTPVASATVPWRRRHNDLQPITMPSPPPAITSSPILTQQPHPTLLFTLFCCTM